MREYSFKRLSLDRIPDLHWLFKASSKFNTTLSEFKRKYNTEYAGVQYLGYLAYDQNSKPAAFYGVIPTLANIHGKSVIIAQSADTLTHPNHQRKGLFTRLALMTYEMAKNEGVHFIYGVANENSFPGFVKKLNWIHNGNLQKFVCKVPMFPLSQFFRKNEFLKKVYDLWIKFVLLFFRKGTLLIENQFDNESLFGLKRNMEYYNYKMYSRKYLLNICSKTIWLKFEGTLKIGDIENCSPDEMACVFRKLKLIAFFAGIRKIQFQCTPNMKDYFKINCTKSQGLPVIFLDLTEKYDPRNLVLTLGDVDTF